MEPLTVTVPEAARMIGCHRCTVYTLIRQKRLETFRLSDRKQFVKVASLKKLIESGSAPDEQAA